MGLIVRRRQASLGRAVGPDDYDPFMSEEPGRRSVLSRLRDGLQNGDDGRPHFVVCGSDALVYTLAEELATTAQRVRLTVIAPRA